MLACSPFRNLGRIVSAVATNYVKVMSFNIHHNSSGWPQSSSPGQDWRRSLVFRSIRIEAPDVIGLQEAYMWQVNHLIEEFPDYNFVGRGRNADGGGESVSILYRKSRFEVLEMESGTFWFSNRPDVPGSKPGRLWGSPTHPRICTWVHLSQKSTNHCFYVFNLHLQHNAGTDPELCRVSSVNLLLERIANRNHSDDPYIIIGDFNATPNSIPIRYLTDAYEGTITYCPESGVLACHELGNPNKVIDVWKHLYPDSNIGTRCNGGSGTGSRIDYIMISPDIGTDIMKIGSKINDRCPSDHCSVTAGLLVPLGGSEYID